VARACAGCGRATRGSRCERCRRAPYGQQQRRERRDWAPIVARGGVICPRCEKPILPGEAWDLGHQDDRSAPTRPEHATCNRRAAAARTNGGR